MQLKLIAQMEIALKKEQLEMMLVTLMRVALILVVQIPKAQMILLQRMDYQFILI